MSEDRETCKCLFCTNGRYENIEHSSINCQNLLEKIEFKCSESKNNKNKFPKMLNHFGYKDTETDSATGKYLSYYIGAFRLNEKKCVIIKPKIDNIDFMKMFTTCLFHTQVITDFEKIYDINFDEEPIYYKDSKPMPDIEPLFIVHFLRLLEIEIHRGLKKNFISREENLSSKIKGKILFSNHIKKNVLNNRLDRVYCRFLEYDINSLENRILKKALKLSIKYLSEMRGVCNRYSYCNSYFHDVDDNVSLKEINNIKINPVYKKYKVLINLAIKIIKLKFYKDTNNKNMSPPFWIDMSLLFEKYVYSLLLDKYPSNEIEYQCKADYGILDFLLLNKKIIIDAKYKLSYDDGEYKIEDIRQLSGYARSEKIMVYLGMKDKIIPCLIIYPNEKASNDDVNLDSKEAISGFSEFYKLDVRLPKKTSNSSV